MSDTTLGAPAVAGVRYAGFWRRFFAKIIDGVILIVIAGIVSAAFGVSLMSEAMVTGEIQFSLPLLLAYAVLYWAWYAVPESSAWQASVGKKLLGVRVTDLQGGRITLVAATIRTWPFWLLSLVSVSQTLAGIVFLASFVAMALVIFTPKKQGLHDLMAKTLVVRA